MARAALRPVSHDDRLSLVEHLDELRTRLVIGLIAFLACFGVCFWQNDVILDLMNRPLEKTAFNEGSQDPFERAATFQSAQRRLYLQEAVTARALAQEERLSEETRRMLQQLASTAAAAAEAAPKATARRPVTLGVGEPFTATFKVAAYAAVLLALPLLLYQAYAFILPAFSPRERQVATPLLLMVPFLFFAGVAFAYFMVLPPAINFLQNFNDDSYDILLQARDFYSFELLVLMAMLLPGQDPVTMLIMMIPLIVLYEGSILLASLLDRRASRALARDEAEPAAADDDELVYPDRNDD